MNLGNWPKRMTKKANQIVEGVVEYVADKQNFYQLSRELSAANEHLEFLFAELGRLHFHGSAALAGVRDEAEIREDIRLVNEDIGEIEKAMQELLKKDEDASGANSTETESAQPYCHKCGKPQSDDNEFCPKCGTRLSK